MGVNRRFRHVEWTLKALTFREVQAHVQCVSGVPQCGAVPPWRPEHLSPDGVLTWAEEHFRATGHRRYDRVVFDTVQWDPPQGVDPRGLPGVTT
ncbi:DUF7848 domain-containing protein [Streptomyces sp. NPDC002454]